MEFTINSIQYRTGKLNAFTQLHITRRLTPCLGHLAGLVGGKVTLKYDEGGTVTDIDGDIADLLAPLSNAVTSLSDEDVEYIINACLEATERKQAGGGWARLRVNGVTMFEGLSLPAMLQIAYYVIKDNLTDFFADLPSLSNLEGLKGFMKDRGLTG